MLKWICLSAAALVCVLTALVATRQGSAIPDVPQNPQRIVSLAPAITETLYALDLGDHVAGVTEFCAWPPEAAQKPKTGGFREVNLEAIARTGADLVVLPSDMAHFRKAIEELGIAVRLFNYQSLPEYLADVRALGHICGKEAEADALAEAFAVTAAAAQSGERPTVLFALLNPDEYQKPVGEMTVIGADGFYNGIIAAAGGQNAYAGKTPFPRLSLEAALALDPDVIVIGAPELARPDALAQKWRSIGKLRGAKGNRLLILNDPGDTVPGPRSLATIKKLARAIQAAREGD